MQLPTVIADHEAEALTVKCLLNMLNVVTDDIGDEDTDVELLLNIEENFFLPKYPGETDKKRRRMRSEDERRQQQFDFCHSLRDTIWEAVQRLPRYTEFAHFFEFDVRQVWLL